MDINKETEAPRRSGVRLPNFAEAEWFVGVEKPRFAIRFYLSFLLKVEEFHDAFKDAIYSADLNGPVKLSYAWMNSLEIFRPQLVVGTKKTSGPFFKIHAIPDNLPEGPYIILTTPILGEDEASEDTAFKRLDCISTVMAIFLGFTAIRYINFQGVINYRSYEINGENIRIRPPNIVEGPNFDRSVWRTVDKFLSSLKDCSAEENQRVTTSLRFLNNAIRENNNFSYYWISIEVLAGGEGKIKMHLGKAYEMKNQHDVERKFHLKKIKKMRNDFFHHGVDPKISVELGRYLQYIYVDIACSVLGLKSHKLADQFLNTVQLNKIFIENVHC